MKERKGKVRYYRRPPDSATDMRPLPHIDGEAHKVPSVVYKNSPRPGHHPGGSSVALSRKPLSNRSTGIPK